MTKLPKRLKTETAGVLLQAAAADRNLQQRDKKKDIDLEYLNSMEIHINNLCTRSDSQQLSSFSVCST